MIIASRPLFAVMSETSGNCIAVCRHVEDAIYLQFDYERRQAGREDKHSFRIDEVTPDEALALMGRPWVSTASIIEMTFSRLPEERL